MSDQWDNRIEVKSETSSRLYIVSQHVAHRHWGCSCPAYRTRRNCKHLASLGLPGNEKPHEIETKANKPEPKLNTFLSGYREYDEGEGRGNPQEWRKAFAEKVEIGEARELLGLPEGASFSQIQKVCGLAVASVLEVLMDEYEQRAAEFVKQGMRPELAAGVKEARFKLEAFGEYLESQKQRLETEAGDVTRELRAKVKGS